MGTVKFFRLFYPYSKMAVRTFSCLKFEDDMDILYLYINIKKFIKMEGLAKILETIQGLKINDSTIGQFCFNVIEREVLIELGEVEIDYKIIQVYNASRNRYKSISPINQDNDIPIQISLSDLDDFFFINNLNILLIPFIFSNDKQCVDLIAYVYKKKNINVFHLLFDSFKKQNDLMIELHLLKARLDKDKEALLTTYDNCNNLNNTKEANLAANLQNKATLKNTNLEIQNHLNQARELLINITQKEQRFFLENATLYLALQFDKDIFYFLIQCSKNPYFYPSVLKLSIPWYYYKYIYINSLIYFDLPYNPYVIKYFLEYWISLEKNVLPANIGYSLCIQKALNFIQKCKKKRVFLYIITQILNSNEKCNLDAQTIILAELSTLYKYINECECRECNIIRTCINDEEYAKKIALIIENDNDSSDCEDNDSSQNKIDIIDNESELAKTFDDELKVNNSQMKNEIHKQLIMKVQTKNKKEKIIGYCPEKDEIRVNPLGVEYSVYEANLIELEDYINKIKMDRNEFNQFLQDYQNNISFPSQLIDQVLDSFEINKIECYKKALINFILTMIEEKKYKAPILKFIMNNYDIVTHIFTKEEKIKFNNIILVNTRDNWRYEEILKEYKSKYINV
ncbi:hypothetical protein EBI_25966 [Enterocytozoon bieneusi H348]|nr:hypothetical protein EBI_25966 [Enterocytozoon bieneusi H348]|eukprot:XP_002650187.1 hypothetical protein EBI_25966 [Enterocytozoon bieneusi H348]